MGTSDVLYGGIFAMYIACFILIGGYVLIRRRRKEAYQEVVFSQTQQEPQSHADMDKRKKDE